MDDQEIRARLADFFCSRSQEQLLQMIRVARRRLSLYRLMRARMSRSSWLNDPSKRSRVERRLEGQRMIYCLSKRVLGLRRRKATAVS